MKRKLAIILFVMCFISLILIGNVTSLASQQATNQKKITPSKEVQPSPDEFDEFSNEDLALIKDSIKQGETQEKELLLDSREMLRVTVLWDSGQLAVSLFDPDGKEISPESPDVSTEIRVPGIEYILFNVKPGTYKLRVVCTEAQGKIEWGAMIEQKSNIKLLVKPDKGVYKKGDKIGLKGRVLDGNKPVCGSKIEAVLMAFSGGGKSTVQLFDDGLHQDGLKDDGLYANEILVSEAGRYDLLTTAAGITPSGIEYAKDCFGEISVSSGTASFNGGIKDQAVDLDKDGVLDTIRVKIGIDVKAAGEYEISGGLFKNDLIGHENSRAKLKPGKNEISLDFGVDEYVMECFPARFQLKNVFLHDINDLEQDIFASMDEMSKTYTTKKYTASMFQRPPEKTNTPAYDYTYQDGPVYTPSRIARFYIGSRYYYINDTKLPMDVAPVVKDGRVFLPLNYVAELLGARVDWNSKEKKATVSAGKTIEIWVNKNKARVNGVKKPIDAKNTKVVPMTVPPGRTMVPLRFIAENMGCKVEWNDSRKEITVTYSR
ncbi:MAG: copper amine oxidase N-terminal domain-containing protein [Chitinophagales bacterium]